MNDTARSRRFGSCLTHRVLGRLGVLGGLALLSGCATIPAHYPSATAEAHLGKSLFSLEMRWSTPARLHDVHGRRIATWRFDQYNYAGCSVTVHTDRREVIREVTWTKGCGPIVPHKPGPKPPVPSAPAKAG